MEVDVADNPAQQRYEIRADGELAGFVTYRKRPDALELVHTKIDDRFEGHGLGSKLVRFALDDIRSRGLRLVPTCPFVRSFVERHAEYQDLVAG